MVSNRPAATNAVSADGRSRALPAYTRGVSIERDVYLFFAIPFSMWRGESRSWIEGSSVSSTSWLPTSDSGSFVVHAFTKKTQKTPARALEVARARAKEVV
jgi:hypothetical protein